MLGQKYNKVPDQSDVVWNRSRIHLCFLYNPSRHHLGISSTPPPNSTKLLYLIIRPYGKIWPYSFLFIRPSCQFFQPSSFLFFRPSLPIRNKIMIWEHRSIAVTKSPGTPWVNSPNPTVRNWIFPSFIYFVYIFKYILHLKSHAYK